MLWRLASAWGDSPPRNSCTTWRLNSIECVRCLAMGFLLESPVQLADSQGPYLSTPKGALQSSEYSLGRRQPPPAPFADRILLAVAHGPPYRISACVVLTSHDLSDSARVNSVGFVK